MKYFQHQYEVIWTTTDDEAILFAEKPDVDFFSYMDIFFESMHDAELAANVITETVPNVTRIIAFYAIVEYDTDDDDYIGLISSSLYGDWLVDEYGCLINFSDRESIQDESDSVDAVA